MAEDQERSTLIAAQRGEPAALDSLAMRWWARMRHWARSVTVSDRDAEDAAQNAWIRVQRNLHRVDPDRPFAHWLKTVTRNAAHDVRGSSQKSATLELPADLPFPGRSPEGRAADRQAVGRALFAFDALPARQREVLQLVDVDGLTPTEAAERLGVSASAVRASLTYARRAVRTQLLESE